MHCRINNNNKNKYQGYNDNDDGDNEFFKRTNEHVNGSFPHTINNYNNNNNKDSERRTNVITNPNSNVNSNSNFDSDLKINCNNDSSNKPNVNYDNYFYVYNDSQHSPPLPSSPPLSSIIDNNNNNNNYNHYYDYISDYYCHQQSRATQSTPSTPSLSPSSSSLSLSKLENFEKNVTKLRLIFPECVPDYIRECLRNESSSNDNNNNNNDDSDDNDNIFLQNIADKLLTIDYPKIVVPESPLTPHPSAPSLTMVADLPPSYDEIIQTIMKGDDNNDNMDYNQEIKPELPSRRRRHQNNMNNGNEANNNNNICLSSQTATTTTTRTRITSSSSSSTLGTRPWISSNKTNSGIEISSTYSSSSLSTATATAKMTTTRTLSSKRTNSNKIYKDYNNIISDFVSQQHTKPNLVEQLLERHTKILKRSIDESNFKYSSSSSPSLSLSPNGELFILPKNKSKNKNGFSSTKSYDSVLLDRDITKKDYKCFISGLNSIIKAIGSSSLSVSDYYSSSNNNSDDNDGTEGESIRKIKTYINVWNKEFFEPRKITIEFLGGKKYRGYFMIIKSV